MYWSFQYSLTSQDLESNNRKLRMKPKSSAFTLITFAIGHWLPLASVFSSTMSSFWKFLHLLFHFGRVWRLHKTASSHITQNSFAMCWIRLYFLLLNSPAFTNWPGGSNTTLDFIAGYCLDIAVVHFGRLPKCQQSAPWIIILPPFLPAVFLMAHLLMVFHACWRETTECLYLSQTPPMWLDAGGFLCQMM